MSEEEIKERWKNMSKKGYCGYWLNTAIRFTTRNMNICGEDCDEEHPDCDDGSIFSDASKDIHTLLSIIDTLKKQLEEKN